MHEYFKGIIPAMLTPVTADDTLDVEGIEKLAKFVSRDGINTVFVLGYAGEGLALNREQRKQVIELTRAAIGAEKKIIAGIFGNSLEEMLTYAADAEKAGADFILATPTNFLGLFENEMVQLFTDIADKSKLPLIIYNCPENVQHISVDMMVKLSRHPNIVGLKQTTDSVELQEMMYALEGEDITLLSGHEYVFLGALALGVDCFIMGGPGNVFPQTCLRIYNAYREGRIEEARREHIRMTKFLMELYALPYNAVASLKGMLEMEGICQRYMKRPSIAPDEAAMDQIRSLMKKYDIKVD